MLTEWKVGDMTGKNGNEFSDWLKQRMAELGLTVADLVRGLEAQGVSVGTDAVRKWRSGLTGQPNQKYIVPLAHVLATPANDIRRKVGYPETITDNRPSSSSVGPVTMPQVSHGGGLWVVPVVGVVPGRLMQDGKGEGVLSVPYSFVEGFAGEAIAVRVDDDCLTNRHVHEGDHLLLDPGAVPYESCVVVVEIEGERLAREWWPEDGMVILRPAGPGLRPERVDPECLKIVGVAREAHRRISLR